MSRPGRFAGDPLPYTEVARLQKEVDNLQSGRVLTCVLLWQALSARLSHSRGPGVDRALAAALYVLNMTDDLKNIAAPEKDAIGLFNEKRRLPKESGKNKRRRAHRINWIFKLSAGMGEDDKEKISNTACQVQEDHVCRPGDAAFHRPMEVRTQLSALRFGDFARVAGKIWTMPLVFPISSGGSVIRTLDGHYKQMAKIRLNQLPESPCF